ncbi:MAG: HAD hydrolase family protein [Planctomycetota bacterium]
MTTTPADVRLMVFDVDGVLTDGGITYHGDAAGGVTESKRFHTKDGLGLRAAMSCGVKVAVLTARRSELVARRMTELGVDALVQGCADKGAEIERLCDRLGVPLSATAYLGDDLVDLPAMGRVGYPMAVADAAAELIELAAYVTKQTGGRGAAREAVEHVLRAQGKWDGVVEAYRGGA